MKRRRGARTRHVVPHTFWIIVFQEAPGGMAHTIARELMTRSPRRWLLSRKSLRPKGNSFERGNEQDEESRSASANPSARFQTLNNVCGLRTNKTATSSIRSEDDNIWEPLQGWELDKQIKKTRTRHRSKIERIDRNIQTLRGSLVVALKCRGIERQSRGSMRLLRPRCNALGITLKRSS